MQPESEFQEFNHMQVIPKVHIKSKIPYLENPVQQKYP